jgi:hypothetical protein
MTRATACAQKTCLDLPPDGGEALLHLLQGEAFQYFLQETNPLNGLVADSTQEGSPASIAAVGLGLAAYTVGVERGFMSRADAVSHTLTTLRFFWNSPQSGAPDATGYRGFFYHFLDMGSGRRTWRCELSTIDSALLIVGALAAAAFFDLDRPEEREIRDLAEALYRRMDWQWAQNGAVTVTHGWKPERGFLRYRWQGYNEALILYLLGLGSPTYPLPAESYPAWTATYRWKRIYGYEYAYAGPLFIHQYSHLWVDFRGIPDQYMRARGSDYFENSRRATYVHQQYAVRNPQGFACACACCWGLSASDGPGPDIRMVDGVQRRFFDYLARGAPFGPNDGTIAPWAAACSLPFAPEIVLPTIQRFLDLGVDRCCHYGFSSSFNPTYRLPDGGFWVSPRNFGLNQGPLLLMIENYRSELLWTLLRRCPHLLVGLRRAGFAGGWLNDSCIAEARNSAAVNTDVIPRPSK